MECVDRHQFLHFEDFADVAAVFGVDAETFKFVKIIFAFGERETFGFWDHNVAVDEDRYGFRGVETLELQKPNVAYQRLLDASIGAVVKEKRITR